MRRFSIIAASFCVCAFMTSETMATTVKEFTDRCIVEIESKSNSYAAGYCTAYFDAAIDNYISKNSVYDDKKRIAEWCTIPEISGENGTLKIAQDLSKFVSDKKRKSDGDQDWVLTKTYVYVVIEKNYGCTIKRKKI